MVGVGIGMVVAMIVAVIMVMVVVMSASKRNRNAVGLAGASALSLAEVAGFHEPFHVMVVTGLLQAHLLLESQHLCPVLAERAVHCCLPAEHFIHPLQKCVQHEAVISEIRSVKKFDIGVIIRNPLGVLFDSADQHA